MPCALDSLPIPVLRGSYRSPWPLGGQNLLLSFLFPFNLLLWCLAFCHLFLSFCLTVPSDPVASSVTFVSTLLLPSPKVWCFIAFFSKLLSYNQQVSLGSVIHSWGFHSVQFTSVAQLCPTLCNPMNRSMPGLPVHHQLLELTQTHVHRVGDAIQLSHPLSSPSPPAPNPSQHQGRFQWVNYLS